MRIRSGANGNGWFYWIEGERELEQPRALKEKKEVSWKQGRLDTIITFAKLCGIDLPEGIESHSDSPCSLNTSDASGSPETQPWKA